MRRIIDFMTEAECVHLRQQGMRYSDIGKKLGLGYKTIKMICSDFDTTYPRGPAKNERDEHAVALLTEIMKEGFFDNPQWKINDLMERLKEKGNTAPRSLVYQLLKTRLGFRFERVRIVPKLQRSPT
jgi:transposase